MMTVAQQILVYLIRASHPLTRLWMITAATRSLSALSLSRRATWPARKNTLVFPKQYWSGSGISSGRPCLHKAWAWSWLWGPRSRRRYLLKNSSYVHLETKIFSRNVREHSLLLVLIAWKLFCCLLLGRSTQILHNYIISTKSTQYADWHISE